MPKRIILLLDGTWNDADFGPYDTNVVRLRDIISNCLDRGGRKFRASKQASGSVSPSDQATRTMIASGRFDGRDHLVFYERGVGTGGFRDQYFGGAFGSGLTRNVRRAYRFLSENYDDGDEVFIFGFSRGSYTARSLAGYVAAAGLLYRQFYTIENESRAWYYYRESPADRVDTALGNIPARKIRISCLGVFDTVGALGVPVPMFWRMNRDLFEFHDVGLSSSAELNLHALAIDEPRLSFEPTLWRQPQFAQPPGKVEQVWFAGCHADVGGGYIDENFRRKDTIALDDITLDWMVGRVLKKWKDFPVKKKGKQGWPEVSTEWSRAKQHESRQLYYRLFPSALRSIDNVGVATGFRETNVARDRHAATIGEFVHESVVDRCGDLIEVNGRKRIYAPQNLLAAVKTGLPDIMTWKGDRVIGRETSRFWEPALERLKKAGFHDLAPDRKLA